MTDKQIKAILTILFIAMIVFGAGLVFWSVGSAIAGHGLVAFLKFATGGTLVGSGFVLGFNYAGWN